MGLFGLAHPELLIFGVEPETAANVLNGLGSEVRAGEPVLAGQMLGFEEWPHRRDRHRPRARAFWPTRWVDTK